MNDHDFRSDAIGVAIPYGIYDLLAHRGAVFVGVSHDTPCLAAPSIAPWWRLEGVERYVRAAQLLILADTGGSKGCRCRAWKTNPPGPTLQLLPAHRNGGLLSPGSSQWNAVEHRLFSEISKNWAGEPLASYQKILNFLGTTKTQTGLALNAYLDRSHYGSGTAVDPDLIRQLRLTSHKTRPSWNYTLAPNV